MTNKIDIKVNIEPELKRILNNIRGKNPLMKEIAALMLDEVYENFEQEGRPKWQSLSKSTIKERERKGFWPGKILQRTGQLLKSITSRYSNNSAEVGTNKVYAAIHQFGGEINFAARTEIFARKRKKGKFTKGKSKNISQGMTFTAHKTVIPARPFLKISEAAMSKIESLIIEWVKK